MRLRGERGSGMVLSLLAMTVMAALSVVVFRVARAQVKESVYQLRVAQARWNAETGLEDALRRLLLDPGAATAYSKSFSGGSFSVSFSTDAPPWVSVRGYSEPLALLGPAARSVSARASLTYSASGDAGNFAQTAFALTGGVCDAYDSAVSVTPGAFTTGCSVWSNGSVSATGVNVIRGDATYYSGSAPSDAAVEGAIIHSTYTRTLPYHDGSAYASANDNATGLTPSSVYDPATQAVSVGTPQSATLAPGNYYFSSLNVDGTLTADTSGGGTVNIYLTGNWTGRPGGAILNSSKVPSRLNVYGQAAAAAYTLRSTTDLHANIEARNAAVSILRDVYGKLVAGSVTVASAGRLHYDLQFGGWVPSRVAWQAGTWSESE